jgi:predicted RNA-binding Zn-ribbon protein involved in translation (DUF1610 family)
VAEGLGVAVAMNREAEHCPVCGSVGARLHSSDKPLGVVCRGCGCKSAVGFVRERDHELAVVDYRCRRCGFKWSCWCILPAELMVGHVFWDVYEGCEKCLHG